MININFNLLKILTMNSLNVKSQGKSLNQLAFYQSASQIYENFKEKYFRSIKVDCLNNSESDSYHKNDMQKEVNVLVRLHEAMQEKSKTTSYSEPVQILTLVPDKWSRMYCSEYFNIVNII